MNSDINKIECILIEMITLLKQYGTGNWAEVLEQCHQSLPRSPVDTANKILSMYAGMGSFNDIILYDSGQVLVSENNEFDRLRSELYYLCRELK